MARYEITAPAPDFHGTTQGIVFADGKAAIESLPDNPALDRLRHKGYRVIDPGNPPPEPEPVAAVEAEPSRRKRRAGQPAPSEEFGETSWPAHS